MTQHSDVFDPHPGDKPPPASPLIQAAALMAGINKTYAELYMSSVSAMLRAMTASVWWPRPIDPGAITDAQRALLDMLPGAALTGGTVARRGISTAPGPHGPIANDRRQKAAVINFPDRRKAAP